MKGTLLVKPKSAQLVYNTEMTGTMVKKRFSITFFLTFWFILPIVSFRILLSRFQLDLRKGKLLLLRMLENYLLGWMNLSSSLKEMKSLSVLSMIMIPFQGTI